MYHTHGKARLIERFVAAWFNTCHRVAVRMNRDEE